MNAPDAPEPAPIPEPEDETQRRRAIAVRRRRARGGRATTTRPQRPEEDGGPQPGAGQGGLPPFRLPPGLF